MEDKRLSLLLVLGALALIAVGGFIWWSDSEEAGGGEETATSGAAPVDPEILNGGRRGGDGGASDVAHLGDAGTTPIIRSGAAREAGRREAAQAHEGPDVRGQRRDDSRRSAGWRLGQARRRIELLEPRVTQYQALVDRFEAEGQPELAERQRAVLDRTRTRLESVRADQTRLQEEAEADGTAGDATAGYEQGEREHPSWQRLREAAAGSN